MIGDGEDMSAFIFNATALAATGGQPEEDGARMHQGPLSLMLHALSGLPPGLMFTLADAQTLCGGSAASTCELLVERLGPDKASRVRTPVSSQTVACAMVIDEIEKSRALVASSDCAEHTKKVLKMQLTQLEQVAAVVQKGEGCVVDGKSLPVYRGPGGRGIS